MLGNTFNIFGGMRVVASVLVPETQRQYFRRPRSKSKRINKKWKKDQSNWRDTMPVWNVGGTLCANPKTVAKFLEL